MKLKSRQEPPTHYQVLGVSPSIAADQLHAHYRELALAHHPDKLVGHPAPEILEAQERFARITEAHAVLRSPKLRVAYDAQLKVLGLTCDVCQGQGTRLTTVKNFRRGTAPVMATCTECRGTGRSPER